MSDPLVLVERDGPVAVVLLHRPKQLNALSDQLMEELVQRLVEFDRDEGVRCIVLGGSERAFAAGADIGQLAEASATRSAASGPRSSRPSPASASAAAASLRCPAT
jgi:enoyl-CoA hydratase